MYRKAVVERKIRAVIEFCYAHFRCTGMWRWSSGRGMASYFGDHRFGYTSRPDNFLFFFFHRILTRKVLCSFPYQHGTN